jgi:predicted DNA-binding transcriptional regulator YafY
MGYEKAGELIELARAMASNAGGLTLDDMVQLTGKKRRTVERMRDVIMATFPQAKEVPDPPTKRFRIPKGVDGFLQEPSAQELSDLGLVIADLKTRDAGGRAASLASLETKIKSAMRQERRRKAETDAEALLQAERIAVQAGPRPHENPAVLLELRKAILEMKMLRFTYHGGSRPGSAREVVPYGILFGRMNYLVAADEGTSKPKNFRLDKIKDLRCLDKSGSPPDDFSLVEFANRSFGFFEGPQEDVVLRVLPSGLDDFQDYRFHPSQTVEDHPAGGKIVRFRASGMLELAWHLFAWGRKIEILEPLSLRQTLATELRVALAHHEEPLQHPYSVTPEKSPS